MRVVLGLHLAALLAAFGLLTGCATTGGPGGTAEESGTLPQPTAIADNVAFWRQVYAEWGRGEVAIHDDEYLGVVYEVVELPGPLHDRYTDMQRAYVRARKHEYRQRLAEVERKLASGRSLSREERGLRDRLVAAGGRSAVFGASERVRAQRGTRERFRRGLEISGRYDRIFRDIMRARGVPEELAFLPHVESSFQLNARSSVGAAGVWQFMPATGREFMTVTPAVDERLDPVIAADGAARYLSDAYRRLGSWPLAITSYNHGVGGMQRAKAIYGDDFGAIARNYKGRAFGFSSRNFYACFLAAQQIASSPARYFPEGLRPAPPLREDRLVLHHRLPASQIAAHYDLSLEQLSTLNLAWRAPVRRGRASLPAGSTVWLPAGSLARVPDQPRPVTDVLIARSEPPAPSQTESQPTRERQPTARAPAAPAQHHVVRRNETLYRVALQYELSVEELRRLNRISPNDNTIRPGQRLRVSG